jgi:tetratricopeptide (TPR) repeat protein
LIIQEGDALDALPLFETILECQRRRHGQLHPDVASALHNVGIAYLRAQSHNEALKAFEEAARIRKGALGREHPQVAVSSDFTVERAKCEVTAMIS